VQAFVNCEAMNRLIVASRENILVLDEAARLVKDPVRRGRLREQSLDHSLMLLDLEERIDAIGGVATSRASLPARVRALGRRLRGTFRRNQERQTITACLNAEVRTEAAYAAALCLPLSPASRHNLRFQSNRVLAYHRCLKGLQVA
jgi:uncharacterized protein (TIGR02284 family)